MWGKCTLSIKYVKWNTNIHKYKGDHELTVDKNNKKIKNNNNAALDLIPFRTIQLLRFVQRTPGHTMLWRHFHNFTYYKLPTLYMPLMFYGPLK